MPATFSHLGRPLCLLRSTIQWLPMLRFSAAPPSLTVLNIKGKERNWRNLTLWIRKQNDQIGSERFSVCKGLVIIIRSSDTALNNSKQILSVCEMVPDLFNMDISLQLTSSMCGQSVQLSVSRVLSLVKPLAFSRLRFLNNKDSDLLSRLDHWLGYR